MVLCLCGREVYKRARFSLLCHVLAGLVSVQLKLDRL